MITGLQLLIYTHRYSRFERAKKLSSYAGVAPFPYQWGSIVRGKPKVHPMSNKTLKKALHMCALRVIRYPGEMKSYFARKVAEGKNKMCVLNAIRNKLLHRIFACVRDQRMYSNMIAA